MWLEEKENSFQKRQKSRNAFSGPSEEELDESSRFLERKGCQRVCHWYLEMLVWKIKTFTLEGKEEVHLSKD